MTAAATVTVDFAAETARFRAELERVNARLRGVESNFKSIQDFGKNLLGAVSIAGLAAFVKTAADAADVLGKTADRLGIASERLTVFQIAAKNTGIEVATANALLQEAQKRLGEASTGSGAAAKTIEALGLKYKDLKDLQPDQLFLAYGDAIAKLSTKQEQAAAAADLFGKKGVESLGFILQGRGAIDEAAAFVDKYGLALSRIEIGQIEAAGDSISNLGLLSQGAGQRIAVGLSPFIQAFSESLAEATGSTTILQDAVSVLGGAGYIGLRIFANAAYTLQAAFFGLAAAGAKYYSFITFGDVAESFRASAKENLAKAEAALLEVKNEEQINAGLAAIYENSRVRAEAAVAKSQAANTPLGVTTLSTDFGGDFGATEQQQNDAKLAIQADYDTARIAAAQAVSDELAVIEGKQVFVHADVNRLIGEDIARTEAATLAVKQGAFDTTVSLLAAFGAKSKAAAKLQVAINKAQSIAEAIQNTRVAVTAALKTGDPYTRIPRAIAIGVFGALQIAAIAKTGFNEVGNIDANGGSAPIGSPTNPVFTQRPEDAPGNVGSVGGGPAQQRGSIQVVINGNFFSSRETVNYLMERLKEEINDKDVVLFSANSQQARELVVP